MPENTSEYFSYTAGGAALGGGLGALASLAADSDSSDIARNAAIGAGVGGLGTGLLRLLKLSQGLGSPLLTGTSLGAGAGYWGIRSARQADIANNLAKEYANMGRVMDAGLEGGSELRRSIFNELSNFYENINPHSSPLTSANLRRIYTQGPQLAKPGDNLMDLLDEVFKGKSPKEINALTNIFDNVTLKDLSSGNKLKRAQSILSSLSDLDPSLGKLEGRIGKTPFTLKQSHNTRKVINKLNDIIGARATSLASDLPFHKYILKPKTLGLGAGGLLGGLMLSNMWRRAKREDQKSRIDSLRDLLL